jgi:succinate dehydrogenase / fumarate reductase cytochrome b subunit
VYKPQLTSILSIFHRATGAILSLASLLLIYWLVSLASGPEAFARAEALLHSGFGLFVLFGVTLSLFYHLGTGIRHLIWDTGRGLEIKQVYLSGILALVATLILTAIFWIFVLI